MIKRGREPMDRSERMIFNNYRALLYTRQMMKQPLTPDRIFELHRILTADTLDDPNAAGRLRTAKEHICVSDEQGTMLHDPPHAAELSERLSAMCIFANATEAEPFIHPVVRAVLLHFWLAYDHPFVDGNGRTARALFYWSMVRQGYWLAEFLSISRIIKQAPGRYGRSFLYTETDDNDATYFILAQMRIIVRAIDELHSYLARKAAELRATAQLIRQSDVIRDFLNHRQLSLVNHALKHPGWQYSIESHRSSHDVAYGTARSDLVELAEQGLVVQGKVGRMYTFLAPGDLQERLTALSNKRATTLASQ
jgi:Fic family protein